MNFLKKHMETFSVLILLIFCYFLFFYKMGNYPLIDVDETRYVAIAKNMINLKDWLTLRLNTELFLEKPPLYFWLLNMSFFFFGKINEVTARIPVGLCASFSVLITYFTVKKLSSIKLGLISALIAATGLEFLILSRISILDMFLSTFVLAAVFMGFLTFFVEDKNKKYFWWLFYIFSALAVLAKGIPGFILPFGILFFAYLISGKFKEIFNPKYMLPGWIFFFLITLPWHIAMFQIHGNLFYREYIFKHHIERFVDSKEIGRKEPFYYFFIVFAIGFIPWSFSFIAMIIEKFNSLIESTKNYFKGSRIFNYSEKWDSLTSYNKFLVLNLIAFLFTFIFFSVSSTKLPTYILPAIPFASVLLANFWNEYIYEEKHHRAICLSTIILNSLLIIGAIVGIFSPFYLPEVINNDVRIFLVPAVLILFIFPTLSILSVIIRKRSLVFFSHVFLMCALAMLSASHIFNFMCQFGENDLIKFALKAKNDKVKLATFYFGRRYSVWYYYDNYVDFQTKNDINWLNDYTKKYPNAYIIVKLKNIPDFENQLKYKSIETGRKYSLIQKI